MQKTVQPKHGKSRNISPRPKTPDDRDKRRTEIEEKINDIRFQLEKIEKNLTKCQEILIQGKMTQQDYVRKKVEGYLRDKQIYEKYLDKLTKEIINMDVKEMEKRDKMMKEITKELQRLNEENKEIIEEYLEKMDIENDVECKYNSEVLNELAQRDYKVNIPEDKLDAQIQEIEEDFQQEILHNHRQHIFPNYLNILQQPKIKQHKH